MFGRVAWPYRQAVMTCARRGRPDGRVEAERRREEAESGEEGGRRDMSWRHKGKGRSRRDRAVRLGQTTRRMDLISKNGIEQIACRQ